MQMYDNCATPIFSNPLYIMITLHVGVILVGPGRFRRKKNSKPEPGRAQVRADRFWTPRYETKTLEYRNDTSLLGLHLVLEFHVFVISEGRTFLLMFSILW